MFFKRFKSRKQIFLTKEEKGNDILSKMGEENVNDMYHTMKRIIDHYKPKEEISLIKEDDMCIAYIHNEEKAVINAQDLIDYFENK